jgi:hypothetical protein
MNNKRIVWLALLLIPCLLGGGFFYALSGESLPCKVIGEDERIIERLRFIANYCYLTSKLTQYGRQKGVDLSTWDRAAFYYLNETNDWLCSCSKKSDPRNSQPLFVITDDGDLVNVVIDDHNGGFGYDSKR